MTQHAHIPKGAAEKAIWSYLTTHRYVTHADLKKHTEVSDWKRSNYIAKLRRLGILHDCARRGTTHVFTILDAEAAQRFAADRRNTLWGAMWTTIRISGPFTQAEVLEAIASIREDATPEKVRKYCAMLLKADYLAVVEKAKHGGRGARYRLVKDTGPLPPVMRTLPCLVDPNVERAVYVAGARQ